MDKKVVITGIGLITPLGYDPELILDGIVSRKNVFGPPSTFDSRDFPGFDPHDGGSAKSSPSWRNADTTPSMAGGSGPFSPGWRSFSGPVAAEIRNFDPEVFQLDRKTLRIMSRDAIFAAAAARVAVKDSGIRIGEDYKPDEVALFGTTGLSGIAFEEVSVMIRHSATPDGKFDSRLFGEVALKKILPTLSFKILTNMPICFVSIFENIQGMNAIYNPWEGQGARAISAGIQAIEDGDARCALVGGCDVKTNLLGFIGLKERGYFSPLRSKGFVPGEGGGFLILEEESNAVSRNAKIYARICPILPGPGITSKSDGGPALTGKEQTECFGRISKIVRSCLENQEPDFPENVFLESLGIKDYESIFPKEIMGDLFAASAAVNVGIGALLSGKGGEGESVIASCCGWGSEKAMFLLEKPDLPSKDGGVPPFLGRAGTGEPANRRVGDALTGLSSGSRDKQELTNVQDRAPCEKKRVVITGIGIVSPIGNSRENFWKNLIAGNSGLGPITLFDASFLSVKIGGEVKEFSNDAMKNFFPLAKTDRDRKIFLGLAAAKEALNDAGYFPERGVGSSDIAAASLHIGVSLEVFFLEDVTPVIHQSEFSSALAREILNNDAGNFRYSLQTPLDRLGEILGEAYGIRGGKFTICSACAAGAQVVGEGFRLISRGDREIAIVGAADSMLNPLGLGGFSLLRALSTENAFPAGACRPFDATRQGTVLGEGAAFLVLETLDRAKKRGAKIYSEILGYGSSLDAYRVSDPEPGGRGAILCMEKALKDAGLSPDRVDCVNAHGTGTPKNDAVETSAIKEVLGKRAREIPVHSVKSMTGHLIGASGAVEAAASALTLALGVVPPTINLKTPDPECDLDYVSDGSRPFSGKTVLSNSFGFGGQNATLIFGKY